MFKPLILSAAALVAAGCAAPAPPMAPAALTVLQREVFAAERSFARSMAERDHAAFAAHLSEQAVFFGTAKALNGKAAVASGWKAFFEKPVAPFSWEPDQVELLSDGTLALSTGPVHGPDGKPIARFNSVWRLEAPGTWRIVFDKGEAWVAPP